MKFSGLSWFRNEGFYYSSYDKPKGSQLSEKTQVHKLFYHKLGTAQSASSHSAQNAAQSNHEVLLSNQVDHSMGRPD